MTFTDDEIETIKALISDHGCDYGLSADWSKIQALGEKLGCLDPIPEPTAEQLERDRQFRESPNGIAMTEMLKRSNDAMAAMMLEQKSDFNFFRDVAWGTKKIKPGDVVRLNLPDDFKA